MRSPWLLGSTLAVALVALHAAPLSAQDDGEFAQGLARRGFTDLAEEVFQKLSSRPGLTPEQRQAADFGMLTILVTALERTGDPRKRIEGSAEVVKKIEAWISANEQSTKVVEAYGQLSWVHQLVGRTQLQLRDLAAAESAFGRAVDVCAKLIDVMKRRTAGTTEGEAANRAREQLMFANYQYIAAQFSRIEALKENPAASFKTVESRLPQLEKFFEEFMWDYENFLLALDGSTYMGRIYQALAEMAAGAGDTESSEKYWKRCFNWIGRGKGPFRDKRYRGDPEVNEVGLRAFYYELSAKIGYGSLLRPRGGPYKKMFEDAIALGEEALSLSPTARHSQWGVSILLDMVKAYMGLGEGEKARAITNELVGLKDPKIRKQVQQVMGEYGGVLPVKDRFLIAEESYARGSYYTAARLYQDIVSELEPGNEYFVRCWLRIGDCYYLTGRYFEAVLALSEFLRLDMQSEVAKDAATKKSRALGALAKLTKDAGIKKSKDDFDRVMAQKGWLAEEEARGQAIQLERQGKHAEAATEWARLAKGASPEVQVEALARVAFNRYKLAEPHLADEAKAKPLIQESIKHFRSHLDAVRRLKEVSPAMLTDVMASMYYGMRGYVRTLKEYDTALEYSKDLMQKFGNAKAEHLMSVLELRMEAFVMKNQPLEAEKEYGTLKKLYDEHQTGATYHKNALTMLAQSFDAEANRAKAKKPELYNTYFNKAADYLLKVAELGGTAGGDEFDRTMSMAHMLYNKAEGDAKGDPANARLNYEKARQLYEKLTGAFKKRIEEDRDPDLMYKVQFRIARCFMGEGAMEKANALCDQMMRDQKEDLDLFELKGDVLTAMAKQLRGNEQSDRYREAAEVFGKAAAVYKRLQAGEPEHKEAYYRNLYKWCEAMFEYKDGFQQLKNFFEQMKNVGVSPEWDGGRWKIRLNELEQAVQLRDAKK
jgi:tetratricopeptide (TPR) repeat protein